jgi:hypothetical protein
MDYEELIDIEPMDRELSPLFYGGKGMRLDYLGKTLSGRTVNLEFQKESGGDHPALRAQRGHPALRAQRDHPALRAQRDHPALRAQRGHPALRAQRGHPALRAQRDHPALRAQRDHPVRLRLPPLRGRGILKTVGKGVQKIPLLRRGGAEGDGVVPCVRGVRKTARFALWGAYVTIEELDIVSEVMEKDKVFSEVMEAEKDYWGESRNRFIQMMQEKHERDAI